MELILRTFKCLHCGEVVNVNSHEDRREKYCSVSCKRKYNRRKRYLKHREEEILYAKKRYKETYIPKRLKIKDL